MENLGTDNINIRHTRHRTRTNKTKPGLTVAIATPDLEVM